MVRARWVIYCLVLAGALWYWRIASNAPHAASFPPMAQASRPCARTADNHSSIAEFRQWADQHTTGQSATTHLVAHPATRVPAPDDLPAAQRLAQLRHDAMRDLIRRNPARAIDEAISPAQRRALPPNIAAHMEEPIDAVGSVHVIGQIGDAARTPIARVARVNGRTYHANFAGPAPARSLDSVKLAGIAMDGQAALRIGAPAVVKPFMALPNAPAANAQPTSGGGGLSTSIPGGTLGAKRVLVIRARFADQGVDPASIGECDAMMAGANAFYVENSFNKTSLTWTITTPPIVLPHSAQWYKDNDPSGYGLAVLDDARAVALAAGYNWSADFDLDIVRYNGGPGDFTGQALVGARGCWLKVTSSGVASHELGHNFGNNHANAWEPNPPGNPIGPGYNNEYGDPFDTMGNAGAGAMHFNACEKSDLAWMTARTVTASGRYTLHAHDLGTQSGGTFFALKIKKDNARNYWLEFRQHPAWASQPWIWNGVGLRWGAWTQSNGGSQVIDVTPGSPFGKEDSPIAIGSTFSDPLARIHITPVGKNGTAPLESVDVVINMGAITNSNAPTLSLAASAYSVPVNTPVTITATAADADGDALAYSWNLGDRSVAGGSNIVTKSWPSPGNYRVRCTVSDMKGKTASRSVIITVGNPTGFTVAGTVTDAAGQPLADVCVHNSAGVGSANYRSALTDIDGTYTLTDLRTGSYTVAAQKASYDFAPDGFANPIALGPNKSNANFKGWPKTWVISGRCTDAGLPVGGVVVSIGTQSVVTDSNGLYAIYGVPDGRYTLTATKTGYNFVISNQWTQPVIVDGADVPNREFENLLIGYNEVKGQINGAPDGTSVEVATLDGRYKTTISINNNPPVGTTPNVYKLYVPLGKWSIRAKATGMSFSPSGWTNPIEVTGNIAGKDFAKDAAQLWSISGRVTDQNVPLPGVAITAGAFSTTTDAAGMYRLAGLSNGAYSLSAAKAGYSFAPVSLDVAVSGADVTGKDFVTTNPVNPPPWIVAAASANPNPVAGTTTTLSVVADDDKGEARLIYSWALVGPAPGSVNIPVNNSHAAQSTLATFTRAGSYTFRVTVSDETGGTATSDAAVTVLQTPTGIAIAPLNPTILANSSLQFTAKLQDQFQQDMPSQPAIAWSLSGGGTIDSAGLMASDGTLGQFTATATAGGISGSTTVTVAAPSGPGTGIARQWYSNIAGSAVADLTTALTYPDLPTGAQLLAPSCQAPTDFADNYGQRLRGYFVCPGSGAYTFYVSSDDASILYLSADQNPANKVKIAELTGAAAPNQWDKYASQQSDPIQLVGGQKYYLEAVHKESNGGDHLQIGVDLPGGVRERPIPAHRIIPLPILSVAATTPTAKEWSSTPASFTVTRSCPLTGDLVVNYTIGGTATPNSDYQPLFGSVTIPNGAPSATISVTPINDTDAESDETVIVRIRDGVDYAVDANAAATITILDDEITATITATDPQATEPLFDPGGGGGADESCDGNYLPPGGGGADLPSDTGTFTITLSRAPGADVTVHYAVSGSAAPGADYETLPATVTIPAGQTSATITVTPLADDLAEVPETVVVTLSSGEGYAVGPPTSATVVIGDLSPVAPALTAMPTGGRSIRLDWADLFSNEDGYEIQRRDSGTWNTVASVAQGVTSWTDSNLAPATPCAYRIRARLGPQYSGYSNEASATTWKLGDVNGDGIVHVADMQIIALNIGLTSANWPQGDVNGDGIVDRVDFAIVLRNLGK